MGKKLGSLQHTGETIVVVVLEALGWSCLWPQS